MQQIQGNYDWNLQLLFYVFIFTSCGKFTPGFARANYDLFYRFA